MAESARHLPLRAGLARPPAQIAPGLRAAADWVEGPYPATLEGRFAARRLNRRGVRMPENAQAAKLASANFQFARLFRKVSTNFGRRLR